MNEKGAEDGPFKNTKWPLLAFLKQNSPIFGYKNDLWNMSLIP